MTLPALIATPTGYDAEAIAAASDAVRLYCGWHIAPVITETLILDGSGYYRQLLPSLHVADVSDVVEVGVALEDEAWNWSATGYLDKNYSYLYAYPYRPVWSDQLRSVVATLTHGYETCPAIVRAVVLGLSRAGLAPLKATTETAGPFSVSLTAQGQAGVLGIGAYESDILERYRVPGRL